MKLENLFSIVCIFLVSACQSKSDGDQGGHGQQKHQEDNKILIERYHFVENACDTEFHEFTSDNAEDLKRNLCNALKNEETNHGCAYESRKRLFEEKCAGEPFPSKTSSFEEILEFSDSEDEIRILSDMTMEVDEDGTQVFTVKNPYKLDLLKNQKITKLIFSDKKLLEVNFNSRYVWVYVVDDKNNIVSNLQTFDNNLKNFSIENREKCHTHFSFQESLSEELRDLKEYYEKKTGLRDHKRFVVRIDLVNDASSNSSLEALILFPIEI